MNLARTECLAGAGISARKTLKKHWSSDPGSKISSIFSIG